MIWSGLGVGSELAAFGAGLGTSCSPAGDGEGRHVSKESGNQIVALVIMTLRASCARDRSIVVQIFLSRSEKL